MNKNWNFFEIDEVPRLHIGLRMIKTAVAVYICAMIGYARGEPAVFSLISAVICMQNDTGQTLQVAVNRMLPTVVGSALGLGIVYVSELTGLINIVPAYYLLVSLMIIPIILFTLIIKKPSISVFTCVVFLAVSVATNNMTNTGYSALMRVVDTFIGVTVALIVNIILPNHRNENKERNVEKEAKKEGENRE